MTPLISFERREKYLLVVGHGKRDNLTAMTDAAAQIHHEVSETNSKFLLVDYRKLEINVHLNEAFNIVRNYEVVQTGFKDVIIAATFEQGGLEFGRYWQAVGSQRGFHIEIFEDINVAEQWLLNQITK